MHGVLQRTGVGERVWGGGLYLNDEHEEIHQGTDDDCKLYTRFQNQQSDFLPSRVLVVIMHVLGPRYRHRGSFGAKLHLYIKVSTFFLLLFFPSLQMSSVARFVSPALKDASYTPVETLDVSVRLRRRLQQPRTNLSTHEGRGCCCRPHKAALPNLPIPFTTL
jgi:hypothetical protein